MYGRWAPARTELRCPGDQSRAPPQPAWWTGPAALARPARPGPARPARPGQPAGLAHQGGALRRPGPRRGGGAGTPLRQGAGRRRVRGRGGPAGPQRVRLGCAGGRRGTAGAAAARRAGTAQRTAPDRSVPPSTGVPRLRPGGPRGPDPRCDHRAGRQPPRGRSRGTRLSSWRSLRSRGPVAPLRRRLPSSLRSSAQTPPAPGRPFLALAPLARARGPLETTSSLVASLLSPDAAGPAPTVLGGAALELAPLPLGQAAPDPEALVVPQRVLQTLGPHLAARADPLGLPGRPALLREERLRVRLRAQRPLLPLRSVAQQIGPGDSAVHQRASFHRPRCRHNPPREGRAFAVKSNQ